MSSTLDAWTTEMPPIGTPLVVMCWHGTYHVGRIETGYRGEPRFEASVGEYDMVTGHTPGMLYLPIPEPRLR